MPVIFRAHPCPACGQPHDFCDPDAFYLSSQAAYAFICPTTRAGAAIRDLDSPGSPCYDCPRTRGL